MRGGKSSCIYAGEECRGVKVVAVFVVLTGVSFFQMTAAACKVLTGKLKMLGSGPP